MTESQPTPSLRKVVVGLAGIALLIYAITRLVGDLSPHASPAAYQGEVLSLQAPGAIPVGASASAAELLVPTPVQVRWRITNVGGTAGIPDCAIAIRMPAVTGVGLRVLRTGQIASSASLTGESTIAPIGAFPPGLWAAQVNVADVTLGCK
jgi:hypothetical protein